jgi:2'-5' RNA ligase
MLRLFVAVDLPEAVRQEVAAMCTQVSEARWVKLHQLHITLRFMGKTPDDALADIRDRLAGVKIPPFPLALQGAGTFPAAADVRRARVLWLGLNPEEPLVQLKREIDSHLGTHAEGEKQGFAPHLTLARFTRRPNDSLTRFLSQHHDYGSTTWQVACFRLYQSTLHSGGAVHDVVATYPLAGVSRDQ